MQACLQIATLSSSRRNSEIKMEVNIFKGKYRRVKNRWILWSAQPGKVLSPSRWNTLFGLHFSGGGITHAPGHTLPYYRGGKAWMRSNILLPYPKEHVQLSTRKPMGQWRKQFFHRHWKLYSEKSYQLGLGKNKMTVKEFSHSLKNVISKIQISQRDAQGPNPIE